MKSSKILVLLCACLLSISTFAQDKRAGAILDQMSTNYQKMKTFNAVFSYGTEGKDKKVSQVYNGNVTVKGVKFKLSMAGQEIFNNGKEIYTYVKDINEVNITDFNASNDSDFSPSKIYSIYKKGYKYIFKEEVKEGSQFYEVVELSPTVKGGNVTKVQIKVNKKDKSVKSWKIWDKGGKATVFNISKFTPNVPTTDQLFTFDAKKYPGVEVIDLR
jgi:outer membrane lipoprotein carrier protein